MRRTTKMTPTEQHCLDTITRWGELNKFSFGLWHGCMEVGNEELRSSSGFSVQTVQRLVDRGLVKFAGENKAVLVSEDLDPKREAMEAALEGFRNHITSAREVVEALEEFLK